MRSQGLRKLKEEKGETSEWGSEWSGQTFSEVQVRMLRARELSGT